MRLKELYIRNFRKIDDLTVQFPHGLCVIVGENNAGKTAIIDALRFMLFSGREFDALRINEDDFRSGTDHAPIEIACTFCDPDDEDEVHFQECLVDLGDGKFDIRLNARVEFNKKTRRTNVKAWGGETEGGSLPSNLYDRIASIYLQPLRDPESGLRPGRHSQISRLIDCITEDVEQAAFETVVSDANEKLRELEPVKSAKTDLNSQMEAIAGVKLKQSIDLIFSEPSFHRIIAGLQPEIAGLPFALNGLGYNNLVFTAATLGTLQESYGYSFRSILVEEPEAHLHPQLQTLLLHHLSAVSSDAGNEVQVVVSSHSPVLASQAPIDSIVSVHESGGKVFAVSMCSILMDADPDKASELKKKLQRFLDATRAELFFARRIIMVEGIAEALLLPVLTKIAGGNLKDSAVTVLNADGINFNAFLPLFGQGKLNLRTVILTDGDAAALGYPASATAQQLKAAEQHIPNLRVELSAITFEHELARSPAILPFMLDAFEILRPQLGGQLKIDLALLATDDQKADAFLEKFLDSKTSKGRFAQELASLLESAPPLQSSSIPAYIRSALVFLEVVPA
jgi:putative ATP-dependent endonuclease of OLD family